jgi:hypothetical protein
LVGNSCAAAPLVSASSRAAVLSSSEPDFHMVLLRHWRRDVTPAALITAP